MGGETGVELTTRSRGPLQFFLVLLLLAGLGCGPKHAAQAAPPANATQTQAASSPQSQAGPSSKPAEHENKISPKEAEELFRSVDEILKFASVETALPIKHEVKRRLTSRDEIEAYVSKHMAEDEDARRLRRSELVLKKFGLLPRDFDLGTFLVALLKEQVAGYYDPKTKTVNLLDWLDVEQQRPVMAHELTHALQDQSFGLEKWMKAGAGDLGESKGEPTPADIENDEIGTARQAVVEGQAMAVLVNYMLAPNGQSLQTSPQILAAIKEGMLVGTPDSPHFQKAPIFLKEALTFPYRYGLDFAAALLSAGGKEKAFAGAFLNPPRSSRQIMEPKTYLSGEHIEPMPLPDFKAIFKNYERFDIGAIGEFDVAVLIDQYAGEVASHALYPEWRGGYYYAAKPKGAAPEPLGLLYVSRWSSSEKASAFAAIYAKSLAKRYVHVRDVDGPAEPTANLDTLESFTGKHSWQTEDGTVVIEVHADTVMVSESLDPPTTELIEKALFAGQEKGR